MSDMATSDLGDALEESKPRIRKLVAAHKRSIVIQGVKFEIRRHKLSNVTYITVRRQDSMGVPLMNFPLDENEYRQEMERRYEASPGIAAPKKGVKRGR